jgi:hypothetical protein
VKDQCLGRRVRDERHTAGEQLEEDDAHRVQVAPAVEGISAALLGAHVLGRPADETRPRERRACARSVRVLLEHLGEAEIDDLDEVEAGAQRLEDDVVGLQVAVHDAERVRLFEGSKRLPQHVDQPPQR